MKRIYILVALILISIFSVNAAANVRIDGADDGIEWVGADYTLLIDEQRSNNVDFAFAKTSVSSEYEIDILLFLSDNVSGSYNKSGFILSLDDGSEISVNQAGAALNGNSDDYYVDSAMTYDVNDGASCEIRIGFKRGLPKEIVLRISFVDGNGNSSIYYPLKIDNPYFVSETQPTEVSSTRPAPTEKVTEKKTEKKTEKQTTVKNKPTESKTEKHNSTKKSSDKTVVYFYEKEVIVSHVYANNNVNADYALTEVVPISSADVTVMSKGIRLQKALCYVGGAVLIGVGAWASLSVKKKKSSPDSEKKESDE